VTLKGRTNHLADHGRYKAKLLIGILISIVCMYLAFRNVHMYEMWQAFKKANYWYMLPVVGVLFFSHFLRALRWRYLLDPIKRLDIHSLFSSLLIGYAANTFMPGHLGEFVRSYVLSKKRKIPMSLVFATIVVERIIDVFSLLSLMLLALFIYPFPDWVVKSGYMMLAGTLGLLVFLVFLKKATLPTMRLIGFILKPWSESVAQRTIATLERFISGISPLKRRRDYIPAGFLSLVIWVCYGLVFYFCLHAFDFVVTYHLGWKVSLILLVITTIAVVVPSSPGYIGTYHWLCQLTLAMFGVPDGPALSFAAVVHGINILPVFVVGLLFAHREGMAILKLSEDGIELENAGYSGKI